MCVIANSHDIQQKAANRVSLKRREGGKTRKGSCSTQYPVTNEEEEKTDRESRDKRKEKKEEFLGKRGPGTYNVASFSCGRRLSVCRYLRPLPHVHC